MLSYNNTLISENCKTSDKSIARSVAIPEIGTSVGEPREDRREERAQEFHSMKGNETVYEARTREVGTSESVQDLYGDGLSSKDKETTRDNNNRIRTVNTELIEQIKNIRSHYAKTNTKGLFLSKKYKKDCAKMVLTEIDINTLLESCIIYIPDTYQIYVDYTMFKSFIIPELYDTIINYTIHKIIYCIQKYGKIELHINLHTFSVSAYNRYKECIILYSKKLQSTVPNFPTLLVAMHLYNIPSCIETISQLLGTLLPQETRRKVVKHDIKSSEKAINTILEIVHITDLSNREIMVDNTPLKIHYNKT